LIIQSGYAGGNGLTGLWLPRCCPWGRAGRSGCWP